jgi:hypothetical protein
MKLSNFILAINQDFYIGGRNVPASYNGGGFLIDNFDLK